MEMMKKIILYTLVVFLVCSCSKGTIYSHYEDLPVTGWNADSIVHFVFSVTDTIEPYDLVVDLRHTERYPFQNVFFFTEFYRIDTLSGDHLIVSDTLEYYLADSRGRWLGNGYGNLKDMPMLFMQNITFPIPGDYRLSVRQGMYGEELKGVSEIGLTVIESDRN